MAGLTLVSVDTRYRRPREGGGEGLVAHPCRVCVEAQAKNVEQYIRNGSIVAIGAKGLAPQEHGGVGKGYSLRGEGVFHLPQDQGLGMIHQVFANAGKVENSGDHERPELLARANAGQEHQARGACNVQ